MRVKEGSIGLYLLGFIEKLKYVFLYYISTLWRGAPMSLQKIHPQKITFALRQGKDLKKFIVDSTAHSLFYGVIGGVVAIALGIKPEVYITMSIIGTAIQFLSGGLFGRFLDFVRRLAKV